MENFILCTMGYLGQGNLTWIPFQTLRIYLGLLFNGVTKL